MQKSPHTAALALTALTFAFGLSQFFRSCLAVMAPELQLDLGLSSAQYGAMSSSFFLAFAFAQLPVGIAFDRYGVGRPTAALLAVGVLSAVAFSLARGPLGGVVAQVGLGIACAPVFMALLHYASENLDGHRYARTVSHSNAFGMLGALCATAPLGWLVHAVGWRAAMAASVPMMGLACWGVWRFARDKGHSAARAESPGTMVLVSLRLLRIAPLWTLIPLCVAMAAGTAFRNTWGGVYLSDVFGLDAGGRGLGLTVLTVACFCSAFVLPMLMRRSHLKSTIMGWVCVSVLAALALWAAPAAGLGVDLALLSLLCIAGMVHPLVMSHGRELVPAALRGRAMGVLNTFVFVGAALASWGFGWIAQRASLQGLGAAAAFGNIFATAALALVLGLLAYAWSPRVRP
ncbi:MFS transporter [Variovorax ginsengisoli]|uniref:MFS family arabinose efflux permease n=1 Tax=Variovorax ginsengisoli TaxID=363844 RepID=A0ABT9S3N5_9BURK|nr:MFS transporter [Variovorax ginsengisoli]MDP9898948.1 putative MFS family arabinose efflux permease [Variovorax ginsengisoli]